MKLDGRAYVSATPEQVWICLNDPAMLSRCIPGCESLVPLWPDCYRATLSVGFSMLRGRYSGTVRLEDKQPFTHYHLLVEGAGRAGFVKGSASMRLSSEGGGTWLEYEGTAEMGGFIAGIGNWMLRRIARILIQRFFAAVEQEVRRAP